MKLRKTDWLFVVAILLIIISAVGLMLGKINYEQFYALVMVALALIGGGAYVRKKEA